MAASEKLSEDDIITFNIGGQIHSTQRSTIDDNVDSQAFLARIIGNQTKISLDGHGRYFLDRDGKYFSLILNYFREKKLLVPDDFQEWKQLISEARFYQIDRLVNEIENRLNRSNEQHQMGFQVTLISKLNQTRRIVKLIGPLKFISLFKIQSIGEKFLTIISSYVDPQTIQCQFTFPYNERLILCQPLDQLQKFVLAKQAKKMGLMVSYCEDYFYLPIQRDAMTRDELSSLLVNKYNGKLLNTNVTYDDSCNLIEYWFLAKSSNETYSNGSQTSVH